MRTPSWPRPGSRSVGRVHMSDFSHRAEPIVKCSRSTQAGRSFAAAQIKLLESGPCQRQKRPPQSGQGIQLYASRYLLIAEHVRASASAVRRAPIYFGGQLRAHVSTTPGVTAIKSACSDFSVISASLPPAMRRLKQDCASPNVARQIRSPTTCHVNACWPRPSTTAPVPSAQRARTRKIGSEHHVAPEANRPSVAPSSVRS